MDFADRSNEAISPPCKRLNKSRILGGITQRITQLIDRDSQTVIKVDSGVVSPQPLLYLLFTYHFAVVFQKHCQNPEGLPLDTHAFPIFAEFTCLYVRFKKTKSVTLWQR